MLFSHYLKRVAAILLLGILLFNFGGYRLFTNYLENRADSKLEASLDKNEYNESDLISIKVAANLPYLANSETYERIDGEITIKGITYNYVKRRLYNDSLELLCIPNMDKTGVKRAGNDFYRLANDIANNNPSKKSTGNNHTHLTKFSVQDFTDDHHSFAWQFRDHDPSATWNKMIFADVKADFLDRLDRPPQA
ncbi:MAG: hypothetical protein JWQ30_2413 [Sediminibacterium sp.]|nr:hypothetical protein [Sediminibacterium sp.]